MDKNGFSLIEVVVAVGIIAAIVPAAYTLGLPEYDRYVSRLKKEAFVDQLFDDRSRAMATGNSLSSEGGDGKSIGVFSAQGSFISLSGGSTSVNIKVDEYEVNIDQNGFIDGL